ncbi:MAG: trypsin-like peptidase domain-containing protein [Pirellulales bacterium]
MIGEIRKTYMPNRWLVRCVVVFFLVCAELVGTGSVGTVSIGTGSSTVGSFFASVPFFTGVSRLYAQPPAASTPATRSVPVRGPIPISVSASSEDRDQLYQELARDVQLLQRELGIYKRVIKLISPSVVHIEATPLSQPNLQQDIEEAGSGILIQVSKLSDKTYVLTNRHVIKHSDKDHIQLELADGRQLQPSRIWSDSKTDVAILEVQGHDLLPARIGDSSQAEIGDIVFAFGSPFNLRQSVTRGIISAMGRSNLDLGNGEVAYQNFMQTDAAINPGNSGGPLVNLRGEVIGLNTAIASSSGGNDGIGFSIPINIAVRIMQQLVETGSVRRGFLGVTLDGYFDNREARRIGLPRMMGTRVKNVTISSPADLADLQVDDIILRYDGKKIDDDDHLISLVKLSEIGKQVELVVFRNGKLLTKLAQIGTSE